MRRRELLAGLTFITPSFLILLFSVNLPVVSAFLLSISEIRRLLTLQKPACKLQADASPRFGRWTRVQRELG